MKKFKNHLFNYNNLGNINNIVYKSNINNYILYSTVITHTYCTNNYDAWGKATSLLVSAYMYAIYIAHDTRYNKNIMC